MSSAATTGRSSSPILEAIAVRRRRLVLSVLQDRTSPVSERELATQLVAIEEEKSLVDVSHEEVEAVHVDLVHAQLPRLEAASLVARDPEEGTVATTTHPALDDPHFQQLVETEADEWDAVVDSLASQRRRTVLAVLEDRADSLDDRDEPMAAADLAAAVHQWETDAESPADESTDVLVSLHHVHLPKLERAGLLAYDADERTVVYQGHPTLDEAWLDFAPDETPRPILTDARTSPEIWTIEGRENVLEHGRSLVDQADDELFLMFTTDGLLEEECFRAFEEALDRGVDVYVGSQTAAVRDLIRERAPEVVIWEPQLDWLNLPPDRERVGRLVFADRQAIMLATLGEQNDAGVHTERAITGTGENNGLVVLLRELLGSRLDHLDAQSEDFRSQIPL